MVPVLNSITIEESILASALFIDGVVDDMAYGLREEDFTTDFTRALFNELKTCSLKRYTPDMVLISQRLAANKRIKEDAHRRIGNLSTVSTNKIIKPWVNELKATSDARNIINTVNGIISSANNIHDMKRWVEQTTTKMQSISHTGSEKSRLKHISEYFQKAQERFEATLRGDDISIKTGIAEIDKQTNGFRRGEYIIVAGRPGAGKTSFGLTVAKNVAMQGHKVGIFSIEVKGDDIVFKLCSMMSSRSVEIPYSVFRGRRKAEDQHIKSFGEMLSQLNQMGIYVNDSGKTTVSDIVTSLNRFIAVEGLDMVILDHIGIVKKGEENRQQKRNEMLQEISIALAETWKDLDVAGLVLVQLKRSQDNKTPTMDDLSECSQFEKDAHLIYLIHVPDKTNVHEKILVCPKARDAGIGTFNIDFSTATTEFIDAPVLGFGEPEGWE